VRRSTAVLSVLSALAARAPLSHADGLILDAAGGYFDMTGAKSTAAAVFGSSGGGIFGGDVGYVFHDHLFVSAGVRSFSRDGERVFTTGPGAPVFKLGHPLSMKLTPIVATFGYRFSEKSLFGGALTPYVGVGGGVTQYKEESTVAGVTESQSQSKGGGLILVGLELGAKPLRLGVEASYSFFPNAIGVGGVSQVYGENDVGGFSIVGKIIFTTHKR
jgi:hypothetical protein